MKKLLIIVGALLSLGATLSYGAQPVELLSGRPESVYNYTNATLALSSFSAASIAAVDPGYHQVTLTNSTSFFYTLDGTSSSATIVSTGYPGAANTDIVIESSKIIYFTLPAGVAATTARYIDKRK